MSEITGINNTTTITVQQKATKPIEKKKDDFNSAFTENKNIKIEITNRGEGEPAGLSYDFYYGNESTKGLKEYYEEGIFVDQTKDKNGNDRFSNQDKLNLVSKFKEIHTQKGFKNDFARMQIGETFEYTKEDYLALAEAAGYKLKNTPKTQPKTETKTETKQEAKAVIDEVPTPHKAKKAPSEPSIMPNTLKPAKPMAKTQLPKEKITIPEDYTTSSEEQIM